MKQISYVAFAIVSAALFCLSWNRRLPITMTETLGFLSGVVCVWLIVKENVWNWPVGIANNLFYVVVFWRARLFADMSLQLVYIALGILGLYRWARGSQGRKLPISRISRLAVLATMVFAAVAIGGLTIYLRSVGDAAPLLDATTAVLSVCAQYLLTKKILENWWLWIITDAISVGLYMYKSLALTALLYLIFLAMCVAGLVEWQRTLHRANAASISPAPAAE